MPAPSAPPERGRPFVIPVTPRVRSLKVVSPRDARQPWWERIYLVALAGGLLVTLKHFFQKKITLQYPEEKHEFRPNYRGAHRLTMDDQGRPKCVACEMCSTACPVECIHIEAAPAPWPDREKYPAVFRIDLLRCIYCGFCVEACPEEAIEMTSNIDLVSYRRSDLLWEKERLLANQPAVRAYRQHPPVGA